MPEEWGASGARLAMPVEVLVESEWCDEEDREFMQGSGKCDRLSVLEDPVFVSLEKGQQTVRFADQGGWRIATRRAGKAGDAAMLRFWLDVVDTAIRNDVTVKARERLYCTANCWREQEFQQGLRRFRPVQAALDDAQQTIDQRLSHETGDRRLDGTNPVDTVKASIDMAVLVKNRDDRLFELREAERKLPSTSTMQLSMPGHWPGTTEKLIIAKGKIGVKRRAAGFLGGEEIHILGTWTATPLEGVSEFYEEEEEGVEQESSPME
jgi:hypothetical protein